jgi:hypothetical protein
LDSAAPIASTVRGAEMVALRHKRSNMAFVGGFIAITIYRG